MCQLESSNGRPLTDQGRGALTRGAKIPRLSFKKVMTLIPPRKPEAAAIAEHRVDAPSKSQKLKTRPRAKAKAPSNKTKRAKRRRIERAQAEQVVTQAEQTQAQAGLSRARDTSGSPSSPCCCSTNAPHDESRTFRRYIRRRTNDRDGDCTL